jgi:hypothetical protein
MCKSADGRRCCSCCSCCSSSSRTGTGRSRRALSVQKQKDAFQQETGGQAQDTKKLEHNCAKK